MSQYQLTTDLIADCMALIPQNLERFNEGQKLFNLYEKSEKIYIDISKMESWDLQYFFSHFFLDSIRYHIEDVFKVAFLSHCLRTIPEFQEKNHNYQLYLEKQKKRQGEWQIDSGKMFCSHDPKTIAAATLHGQDRFPPNTLEELCESYKNVMSK